MSNIAEIPLSLLTPLNRGQVNISADAVQLISDPEQWSYSAAARFRLPGIESEPRAIRVALRMEAGTFGIGWLSEDGSEWIVRKPAAADDGNIEVELAVPAGTDGGSLVLDNWTANQEPARGYIDRIQITDTAKPASTPAQPEVPEIIDTLYQAALAAEERGNAAVANACYEAVLRRLPSHVGSIAGLGRVRFVPPQQPLRDEVNRRVAIDIAEVVIEVRNPCNYRCFYCVAAGANNVPVQRFDLDRIHSAYAQIQSKVIVTSFDCGGGEPTVHPQFPDLLRICAQYGAVSFPSNNSQNPERWLPKDGTAKRIMVRSALHPEAEGNLERYAAHARFLIDAGCYFTSTFIAHPTRIPKISEYQDYFQSRGIPFDPVSFIGHYEGREYPHAYSEEEKNLVGLGGSSRYWLHSIEPHVTRIRNFRGIPCIAGYRSIYISSQGMLRRCVYDYQTIDAPLRTPEPCGVGNCGCGLLLDKLNSQDLTFYRAWSEFLGHEKLQLDWLEPFAQSLGYESYDHGMTTEGANIYDALMSAHGKDEFIEK